jgi:hypothetical protein
MKYLLNIILLSTALTSTADARAEGFRIGEGGLADVIRKMCLCPNSDEVVKHNNLKSSTAIPAEAVLRSPIPSRHEIKDFQSTIERLTGERDELNQAKSILEAILKTRDAELAIAQTTINELRPDAEQATRYKARFVWYVLPLFLGCVGMICFSLWREGLLRIERRMHANTKKTRDDLEAKVIDLKSVRDRVAGLSEEGIRDLASIIHGYPDLTDPETQRHVREAAIRLGRADVKNRSDADIAKVRRLPRSTPK